MSKNITILTGSMRPNSVGDRLLPIVRKELEASGATVEVADVKELNLPFVDSAITPAAESFEITHDSVQAWQKMVRRSDSLVLLVPEYNNQPSAVQKNAIDWLYADWKDKPVGVVSYGWGGGQLAAELIHKLMVKVGANPLEKTAALFFGKDITPEGDIVDEQSVRSQVATVAQATGV